MSECECVWCVSVCKCGGQCGCVSVHECALHGVSR